MAKCPNCGEELEEGASFCKHCGTKLSVSPPESQASAGPLFEDEVKSVVTKRLDGIKNKDESAVKALVDERYSKFDDWPPFTRQQASEALQNEFGAFKVLTGYEYELKDFKADTFGDVAVATFTIHYQGTIRNNPFDITSRVTTVLRKQGSEWKVVHEHFSRFPQATQRQQLMGPRRGRWPF